MQNEIAERNWNSIDTHDEITYYCFYLTDNLVKKSFTGAFGIFYDRLIASKRII